MPRFILRHMKTKANLSRTQIPLALIGGMAFTLPSESMAQPTLIGVGDLEGGLVWSYSRGISRDGSTVFGVSLDGVGDEVSFLWTQEAEITAIGVLPGDRSYSKPFGASFDGSYIFGVSAMADDNVPYIWHAATGIQPIYAFPNGENLDVVVSVLTDPLTVFGTDHTSGEALFLNLLTSETTYLGSLPGGEHGSTAADCTPDGSVAVGVSGSARGYEAFIWDPLNGMQDLGDWPLHVLGTAAYAVSGDGWTVVGCALIGEYQCEAFFWDRGHGLVLLGDLPGGAHGSNAFSVSADGGRIVMQATTEYSMAALWDPIRGMRSITDVFDEYGIDYDDWIIYGGFGFGISDDGTMLTGYGTNPEGFAEGWIVRLPAFCSCDTTGVNGQPDHTVNSIDFFALLTNWGPCAAPPPGCPWDNTGPNGHRDAQVDHLDFFELLQNWGPCPR